MTKIKKMRQFFLPVGLLFAIFFALLLPVFKGVSI